MGATKVGLPWVLSIVVIIVCLLRLLHYSKRRRSRTFREWQPLEVVSVRDLAVLVTGRPATNINWKFVDAVLLVIIVLTLVGGFMREGKSPFRWLSDGGASAESSKPVRAR